MGLLAEVMRDKRVACKGFCGLITLIVAIILIAESFDALDAHEYGLLYHGVAVRLDNDNVYSAGRYFVGLGNYFVLYPRSQQYLEFSYSGGGANPPLDVWSSDGQVIYLEASLYYRLNPSALHDLYYTYKEEEWRDVVASIAAETLRDVATRYETLTFFTNRSVIDDDMQGALALRLYNDMKINLTTFNLLGIDLPTKFEQAVLNKLISAQDVLTLQRLRDSQLIRQAISVVAARGDANITQLEANARAAGLAITKAVEAETFVQYAEVRAQELQSLASSLGFSDAKQLLQYIYTDVMRSGKAKVAVGVPNILTNL